jgi:hypothetical protein
VFCVRVHIIQNEAAKANLCLKCFGYRLTEFNNKDIMLSIAFDPTMLTSSDSKTTRYMVAKYKIGMHLLYNTNY